VSPAARRWTDRGIAVAIFTVVLMTTVAFSRSQGVHRDEAYYMDAGEQYAGYWEQTLTGQLKQPFSDGSIRRFWDYNHEHPPLMKLLYGLSWRLLHRCDCAQESQWHAGASVLKAGKHRTLGWFSEITAFRFPTMICFALLCMLVFCWSLEAHRLRTGTDGGHAGAVAAALLMAAQPRAFFHAETASFDLPAAMLWFACAYAYWRALASKRQVLAGLTVGVLYGLFLATKLQSFFLPFALQTHYGLLLCAHLLRVYRRAGSRLEKIFAIALMPVAFIPVVCVFAYQFATKTSGDR
jgi:4-amino-4-deoxy-L-arabinose transferase-like glycosyltransferase